MTTLNGGDDDGTTYFSLLHRNLEVLFSYVSCCVLFFCDKILSLFTNKDSFRELWNQMISPKSGLELQSHRFRLRTYQNCLVGSELVDWLLMYEKTSTR